VMSTSGSERDICAELATYPAWPPMSLRSMSRWATWWHFRMLLAPLAARDRTGRLAFSRRPSHAGTLADAMTDGEVIRANTVTDPPAASATSVIVASRDHANRGLAGRFIMADHGEAGAAGQDEPGRGVVIHSPTTTYPQ